MKLLFFLLAILSLFLAPVESVRATKADASHTQKFSPPRNGDVKRVTRRDLEEAAAQVLGDKAAAGGDPMPEPTKHSFWEGMKILEQQVGEGFEAFRQKRAENAQKEVEEAKKQMEGKVPQKLRDMGPEQPKNSKNQPRHVEAEGEGGDGLFPYDDFEWNAGAELPSVF